MEKKDNLESIKKVQMVEISIDGKEGMTGTGKKVR